MKMGHMLESVPVICLCRQPRRRRRRQSGRRTRKRNVAGKRRRSGNAWRRTTRCSRPLGSSCLLEPGRHRRTKAWKYGIGCCRYTYCGARADSTKHSDVKPLTILLVSSVAGAAGKAGSVAKVRPGRRCRRCAARRGKLLQHLDTWISPQAQAARISPAFHLDNRHGFVRCVVFAQVVLRNLAL